MPLYEYECDACSHRFEKIQKFSDPLEDTCPKCGGHVHKLMSSPAIQFKGSGFYITDYAKKDYVSASKADGKAESGGKTDAAGDKSSGTAKADSGSSEKTTTSSDSASSASSTSPAPSTSSSKE